MFDKTEREAINDVVVLLLDEVRSKFNLALELDSRVSQGIEDPRSDAIGFKVRKAGVTQGRTMPLVINLRDLQWDAGRAKLSADARRRLPLEILELSRPGTAVKEED